MECRRHSASNPGVRCPQPYLPPTLFISLEGVASRGFHAHSEQCLAEAGSLSRGASVCLGLQVAPALRSRQDPRWDLPSLPCLSLRLLRQREGDKEMLEPGNTAGLGWGVGVDLDPPLPLPTTTSRATAGWTAWGYVAPPRQGWDIKAGSAGARQPSSVSRAPISA